MRYDELRGRGLCLLDYLGGRVERVRGGYRRPDARSPEECQDEFGAVLEEEHDDVVLVNAELVEPRRDFARSELDVGVGVGLAGVAVNEAGAVFELGDVFEAVGVEREVVGDVNIGEFGPENELVIIWVIHWGVFGWRESEGK